jgi:hypothetical protein
MTSVSRNPENIRTPFLDSLKHEEAIQASKKQSESTISRFFPESITLIM